MLLVLHKDMVYEQESSPFLSTDAIVNKYVQLLPKHYNVAGNFIFASGTTLNDAINLPASRLYDFVSGLWNGDTDDIPLTDLPHILFRGPTIVGQHFIEDQIQYLNAAQVTALKTLIRVINEEAPWFIGNQDTYMARFKIVAAKLSPETLKIFVPPPK